MLWACTVLSGTAAEWCSIIGGIHYEHSERLQLPTLNFQVEAENKKSQEFTINLEHSLEYKHVPLTDKGLA